MGPFILKTRAITGDLVPYNGEHREYTDRHQLVKDAITLARTFDIGLYIVDFPADRVEAFLDGAREHVYVTVGGAFDFAAEDWQ